MIFAWSRDPDPAHTNQQDGDSLVTLLRVSLYLKFSALSVYVSKCNEKS